MNRRKKYNPVSANTQSGAGHHRCEDNYLPRFTGHWNGVSCSNRLLINNYTLWAKFYVSCSLKYTQYTHCIKDACNLLIWSFKLFVSQSYQRQITWARTLVQTLLKAQLDFFFFLHEGDFYICPQGEKKVPVKAVGTLWQDQWQGEIFPFYDGRSYFCCDLKTGKTSLPYSIF